jgi:hypothetical integral membrane protein (TIGR02206 family)
MLLFAPPFQNYGTEHFLWLLAGLASMACWIGIGRSRPTELDKRRVGLVMSLIPVVLWAFVSAYAAIWIRPVELETILPFHACYFLNLLMPVMLWRRWYFLFEISYFMIMGGCIQALFTPDMQTVFPDYINVRYFFVHIGLAQSVLYAIFVYGFRPTWKSLGKSFLWVNIYFVFTNCVNFLLNTNFMYLRHKPTTPTLLDLFGDWPWYILGGEVLALTLFLVVFLPFVILPRKVETVS